MQSCVFIKMPYVHISEQKPQTTLTIRVIKKYELNLGPLEPISEH